MSSGHLRQSIAESSCFTGAPDDLLDRLLVLATIRREIELRANQPFRPRRR